MYPETTRMGVCTFTSTKISSQKVKVEYKNKCIQLSPVIRCYFDLFVTLNLMIAQNVRALARVNDIPVINPTKYLWTGLYCGTYWKHNLITTFYAQQHGPKKHILS
jgi:hypothetical protein